MSQYYEIMSFTCAYPNQIDKVIDILDHKKHIKHRLYRHHAITVAFPSFRSKISYSKMWKGLAEI
jgi:TFIIF-interacting CTD phosphatase-like protein